MTRTLIKSHLIVTMDAGRRLLPGGGVIVSGSRIERVLTSDELNALGHFDGEVIDAGRLTLVPGFIQTHVHLCQTLFRGLADDLELLDWLKLRTFPLEAAHSPSSMYASAILGIAELVHSGTTTIMDMGSVHHEEEVVRAIHETGIRAYVGKAMMDINDLYGKLREPTSEAVTSTLHQAERWHRSSEDRIRYAVAPRFVLSCSDGLLKEAYEMTRSFPGMLFHTHASENRNELEAVRARCGVGNVEFFDEIGILHSNVCLAHCIWLNEREVGLLHERNARVMHCPSSNLKLGSGIARVPVLLARGITVSLGADGAPCNNTLNMFQEMRLAALIQKPLNGPTSMTARTVFEMATVGGAATLGREDDLGAVGPGKIADLVLLDLGEVWNPSHSLNDESVYSSIVYTGSSSNVHDVMVDGKWVLWEGHHTTLDGGRAVASARKELRLLLERSGV
jgi:5-methylthioadenosine/S-adenosylhomocysteine deaminase